MKAYAGLVVVWAIAARCLFVGYIGMRFPEKFMENPWKWPRLICNNIEGTAAFFILLGCMWAGFGLLIVYAILTGQAS